MNAPEALAFIVAHLDPDADPVLDTHTVALLLPLAAVVDVDGYRPSDDQWTPTYSTTGCYRAIARGWTIKRGKAVGRYDFTTDGQTFNRSQLLDHIEHQRKLYARLVQTSPSTLGAAT